MAPHALALVQTRASLLAAKDFEGVKKSMPTTVAAAVEQGLPMVVLAREVDVRAYIEFELVHLAMAVNIDARLNIQAHQLPIVAEMLAEEFKTESIEDISVCFRRGSSGRYGEVYRIDALVITKWMRKYLDEKYQEVEAQQARAKKKTAMTAAESNTYAENLKKFYEGWFSTKFENRDDEYKRYREAMTKQRSEQEEPGAATIKPKNDEVPKETGD